MRAWRMEAGAKRVLSDITIVKKVCVARWWIKTSFVGIYI
jgi:hypothetical protein